MKRELLEETGIEGKIKTVLPLFSYKNDKQEPVELNMYLVEAKMDAQTRTEHYEDKICWFPIDEVMNVLTQNNLKKYFASVYQKVEEGARV